MWDDSLIYVSLVGSSPPAVQAPQDRCHAHIRLSRALRWSRVWQPLLLAVWPTQRMGWGPGCSSNCFHSLPLSEAATGIPPEASCLIHTQVGSSPLFDWDTRSKVCSCVWAFEFASQWSRNSWGLDGGGVLVFRKEQIYKLESVSHYRYQYWCGNQNFSLCFLSSLSVVSLMYSWELRPETVEW